MLMEIFFCHQRTGTRRRYQDDGISDDEIEGKRTFDLDEKLRCDRFNCDLVKHMEGKGELAKKDRVFNTVLIQPTFNRPVTLNPHVTRGEIRLAVGFMGCSIWGTECYLCSVSLLF